MVPIGSSSISPASSHHRSAVYESVTGLDGFEACVSPGLSIFPKAYWTAPISRFPENGCPMATIWNWSGYSTVSSRGVSGSGRWWRMRAAVHARIRFRAGACNPAGDRVGNQAGRAGSHQDAVAVMAISGEQAAAGHRPQHREFAFRCWREPGPGSGGRAVEQAGERGVARVAELPLQCLRQCSGRSPLLLRMRPQSASRLLVAPGTCGSTGPEAREFRAAVRIP